MSSTIPVDHRLKAENRVLEICKSLGADFYLNPIAGLDLYNRETFLNAGVELRFINPDSVYYKQYTDEFVPFLSMVDVVMFNDVQEVNNKLRLFKLV